MRVGCGSATIGIFASQWLGHADEVIVVDDHITGVLTEHQAGSFLDMRPAGIRVRGRRSTPGRYFQVANPGHGLGRHRHRRPAGDHRAHRPEARLARPAPADGLHHRRARRLVRARRRRCARSPPRCRAAIAAAVARIGENCEPALCTVLFMAGAGGSLRAGATENPVLLTRAVQRGRARVTSGGAPVYVWPGGGITYMVDVAAHARERLRQRADAGAGRARSSSPSRSPTMPRWAAMSGACAGSHDVLAEATAARHGPARGWRDFPQRDPTAIRCQRVLPGNGRLHLQHGPIDCLCRA